MSPKWSKEEIESLKRLLKKLLDEDVLDQARVVAKQLVGLLPTEWEQWFYLGVITARLGDPKTAEAYLGKALELGGDKFPISVQMAFTCRLRGDLEDAITWCRRGLDLKPADASLHQVLADLYAHSGEPEKAVEILEVLLRMPSLAQAELFSTLTELGRLYLSMQKLDNAVTYFREALRMDGSNPTLWTNLGHCLSRKGDRKEAIEAFQRAARLLPDSHNLYNLGDAFLGVKEPTKAIPPLFEAVRRNPDYALAHYDLSLAYFTLGRYLEGAEEARAALRTDPEMMTGQINLGTSATTNLGLCLMNLKRYEEALICFRRNEQALASTYFNIGLTLFRMKRNQEALKQFKRALEIAPDDAEYLNLLGQTYTQTGNYKAAEKYLRRSLELDPENADSYHDLGNLLLKLKDRRKESLRYFERATELNPDYEWAYYCIACYYSLANKKTKALEYLHKALEKGMHDKDWIDADHDLDNLRADPRFNKLMAQFFKKESSAVESQKSNGKAKKK